MRKNYFLTFLLLLSIVCRQHAGAQVTYRFTALSGTYTALSGATNVTLFGTANDGYNGFIPLGFNFYYNGAATATTTVGVSTNGFMTLAGFLNNSTPANNLTSGLSGRRPVIAPLWDDLAVTSATTGISYKVTGTTPNRIFTMQWQNIHWQQSYVPIAGSMQVKLYETSNFIDFQYDSTGTTQSESASIGLTTGATGSGTFASVQNTGTAPTISTTAEAATLTGMLHAGQIYRWSYAPTASGTTVVCLGQTINLNVTGIAGATFTWTGPNITPTTGPTLTITNAQLADGGTYYVTQTYNGAESAADSIIVTVGSPQPGGLPDGAANTPICSGQTLNFSVTNFSPAYTYSWTGPNAYNSPLASPSIPDVAVTDAGDYIVTATSFNGCTQSDTVHVDVIQTDTAGIDISVAPNDTICVGDDAEFSSVITNGGSDPQYQWVRNSHWVLGAVDSFWGSNQLITNDTIFCILTSNKTCVYNPVDSSNRIVISLASYLAPSVTLTASTNVTLPGQPIDFTASAINAGTNPTYEWFRNGILIPNVTGTTYTGYNLTMNDQIRVIVHSSYTCAAVDTATDFWGNPNIVVPTGVVSVNNGKDITLYPNPNPGEFNVAGTASGNTVQAAIVNVMGQEIYNGTAEVINGRFNMHVALDNNLPAGMYIMHLRSGNSRNIIRFSISK
ncbi:MAG: T9SS type A sorting domain-containing protein [Bacteroidetes bacterium]|nr:T9SS type A sorting domain-containing protein [Bacteroidota bacterium]